MDFFLQILVSGFVVGGIYSLVALGFVLIYKSSDAINFAQGEFLLIGAYVSLTLIATYHIPLIPALLLTLIFSAILGFVIERLVLRPFIGEPVISMIMATIGLSSLLAGIVHIIWGTQTRVFPPLFGSDSVSLGPVVISPIYLWSLFVIFLLLGMAIVQAFAQMAFWMHMKDRGHFFPIIGIVGGVFVVIMLVALALLWTWW